MCLTNPNDNTNQFTMTNKMSDVASKASKAETAAWLWKCVTHFVAVGVSIVLVAKFLGMEWDKTARTGTILLLTALSMRGSEAVKKHGGEAESVGTPVKQQPFEKKVKSYASAVKTDLPKTDTAKFELAKLNVVEPTMAAETAVTNADKGSAKAAVPKKLTKEEKLALSEKARVAMGASPIRQADLVL